MRPRRRARRSVEADERHRAADAHAAGRRDRDRQGWRLDVVGGRDVDVADRPEAADCDVPDARGVVAVDVRDRDGRACRERSRLYADAERVDGAVRRRRDVDPAARATDLGEVVDVRPLRAGVVEDRDLSADRDEPAGAGESDTGEVFVHRRLDADDIASAAARGDLRPRPDLRLGRTLHVGDDDGGAHADEPAGDRAGQAQDLEVVVRADTNAVPGDDRPIDRRERSRGHRRAGCAREGVRRRARVGGCRARDARIGRGFLRRDARVHERVAVGGPVGGVVVRVHRLARERHVVVGLVVAARVGDLRSREVRGARHPRRRGRSRGSHEDVLVAGRAVLVVARGGLVRASLSAAALREAMPLVGVVLRVLGRVERGRRLDMLPLVTVPVGVEDLVALGVREAGAPLGIHPLAEVGVRLERGARAGSRRLVVDAIARIPHEVAERVAGPRGPGALVAPVVAGGRRGERVRLGLPIGGVGRNGERLVLLGRVRLRRRAVLHDIALVVVDVRVSAGRGRVRPCPPVRTGGRVVVGSCGLRADGPHRHRAGDADEAAADADRVRRHVLA